MRMRPLGLAVAFLLLPGVLLAPVWPLAGLGANEDDVLYYFPSRVFFHETIRSGHWPWLNPWNGADRPFVADPQSAVWYPFTWLFAALPPVWAYPICLWAHYSLALWGMYRLTRAADLDRRAAMFGALVFAFGGFMLAHRAHFTMQQAAAWTPWVLWRIERFARGGTGSPRRSAGRLVSAVGVGLLQCLAGHVQIAALTALGSLVYLLGHRRAASPPHGAAGLTPLHGAAWPAAAVRWLVTWTCVAGLFAVQWLPTLAYVRICTRAHRTYADFTENSWNPASIIGWVLPMLFGQRTPNLFDQAYWGPSHQCEQFGYVGVLPLLLALLGLRAGWRADRVRRPWVILAVFALLLALGQYGPVCPLLYWLPGSSLFRVPARALVLVDLAVATLAAVTLHDLAAARSPARARLRAVALLWTKPPVRAGLLLIIVPMAVVLATVWALPAETRSAALRALRPWNPAILVPLGIAVASFVGLRHIARQWRQPQWLWVAVGLATLDLGVIGWTIDVPAGVTRVRALLSGSDETWLAPLQESDHRLWVVTDTAGVYRDPARKRAANTNALVHVRALTDYGPLQPVLYDRHFAFEPWGTTRRAAELLQDTRWMRPFDVGWVLLCEPNWPSPEGCEPVDTSPPAERLFRNPTAPGMAFLENPAEPGAVHYVERGPAAFTVNVDTWPDSEPNAGTPGANPRVVVSRLALPGWRATLDGKPCAIERACDALLAVRVPRGQAAVVECNYFPPGLYEGAFISILSTATLAALAFALGRRRRRAVPSRSTRASSG